MARSCLIASFISEPGEELLGCCVMLCCPGQILPSFLLLKLESGGGEDVIRTIHMMVTSE